MATKRISDQSSNGEIDDMAMVAEALRAVSGESSAQSEEEEMLLAGMAGEQPRLRGPAISPASFGQLGDHGAPANNGDIGLLLDVVLSLTVELGRTRLTVRDVLALGPGSIVELDKLAGEPVDIAVNGTCIAKGEVVVVDEKFAVRVTEILSPSRRIASAI